MQFIQRAHTSPARSRRGGLLPGAALLSGLIAGSFAGTAFAQVPRINTLILKAEGPLVPLKKQERKRTPDYSLLTVSGAEDLAERLDAAWEAKEGAERKANKSSKSKFGGDEEQERGDYLEAYLFRLRQRAFPYDSIDADAYAQALRHIERMKKAGARETSGLTPGVAPLGPGVPPAADDWIFVGPKNLPTPYQIYYGPPGSFTSGRVNAIAYDRKRPNVAYLTGAQGGVWRTLDAGKNWTPLGDKWTTLYASAVAVSSATSDKVYVGTGDYDGSTGAEFASGLMYSSNATSATPTWTKIGDIIMAQQCVSAIAIDYSTPFTIVVSTGHGFQAGGLYRTTDGGVTWADVTPAGLKGDWSQVSIGNFDNTAGLRRTYYASRVGQGIFRSFDKGLTWTKLNVPLAFNRPDNPAGGLGLRVAASKLDPKTAYVIDASSTSLDGRVFKTVDNGETWSDITGTYPTTAGTYNNFAQSFYDLHITPVTSVDSTNKLRDQVYSGAIALSSTPDGGPNWTDISFTLTPSARTHNDQHATEPDPFNILKALVGNDGGVYSVTYSPTKRDWTFDGSLSATLGITQFYHADWSLSDPNLFIGGTQDNATPQSSGDPLVWKNVGGGDGGGCALNVANGNIQYTSSQNGSLYRTTDNWVTTIPFNPNWGDTTNSVTIASAPPFVGVIATNQTPAFAEYMFYGTQYLWRFSDKAGWLSNAGKVKPMGDQALTTAPNYVSAIAVSATPLLSSGGGIQIPAGQIVYAGTSDGRLWLTVNAAGTVGTALRSDVDAANKIEWKEIVGSGLPRRAITGISISPNNPGDILVTLSGTGSGHLFRCANTLSPAPRVTDQSGFGANSLPNLPANDIARDPGDPENRLYVATDRGVFATQDAGSNWENWTNAVKPANLPAVQCMAIKATNRPPAGPGYLNVATFGRGIYRVALPALAEPDLQVKITATRNEDTLNISVSVINNGGQANNVQVTDVTLQPDRGAALKPTNAAFPQGLGGIGPSGVRLLNYTFDGGRLRTGTAATISISLTYNQGAVTPPKSVRLRLP